MRRRRVGSVGGAPAEEEGGDLSLRFVVGFGLVSSCLPWSWSWSFSSRLTQSTTGSETARAWIAVGSVRARVVARAPPMWVP